MKKTIFIFFVLILIEHFIFTEQLSSNKHIIERKVYDAKVIYTSTTAESQITEEPLNKEVIVKKNNSGYLTEIEVYITIPENYTSDELNINTDIFNAIKEYQNLVPGYPIELIITINNNSPVNYTYKDKSLKISTINIINQESSKNYTITSAIGFDNNRLTTLTAPYRTYNSAIMDLYDYKSVTKQNKKDLNTKNLNKKLNKIGYKGIKEIDKYYLDFYNDKYNLNATSLTEFPLDIQKEIFTGNTTGIKEKNPTIISLAYNYFHNNLLTIRTNLTNYYDIVTLMQENNDFNDYFTNNLSIISSANTIQLKGMYLQLNKEYTTNAFLSYDYNIALDFVIEKMSNYN